MKRIISSCYHTGRLFSTKFRQVNSATYSRLGLLAGGATFTGLALATYYNQESLTLFKSRLASQLFVEAAAGRPQPNVFTQTKDHSLYLWIHLTPTADVKQVAKIVANLQKYVDEISPPDLKDESDEVWAGVGFGYNFYSQVSGSRPSKNFNYPHRKGPNGDMPSTGGEIFIHAKSHQVSKLFELAQKIYHVLPSGSVQNFQDVYSFVYRNGRDLSGFIDGTENAADEDIRLQIACENTGASYCITQRWIHKMDLIMNEKDPKLEAMIGRSRSDSTELKKKPATSHVARMTSGPEFNSKKPVEIVRQSQPYGTMGSEAGLFFIGFAKDPNNFEYMLERMVGAATDGLSDDSMKLARCVSGNYWYFPAVDELQRIVETKEKK